MADVNPTAVIGCGATIEPFAVVRAGAVIGDRCRIHSGAVVGRDCRLHSPRLFAAEAPGKKKLFPWLYAFADNGRVTGERHVGRWFNIGTPADLEALDLELRERPPTLPAH